MLAVIRIRGTVDVSRDKEDTMRMLGLKKKNAAALLPDTASIKGMIQKVGDHVAWGEVGDDLAKKFGGKKVFHLKPPKRGFRSVKQHWPKGDLGYRGAEIEKLIERMM